MNELIILGAKIELAKREFFFYCNLKAPDFYKPERKYLVDLCDDLQEFYEGDDEVLVINEPPRHGKSRTAGLLVEWVLGKNKTEKIMTGSYNETLSTMFSKNVRNSIQEVKADPYKVVYSDVFPDSKIKQGDGAMNLWSLEGGYNNYLATSPTGTATGFGCSLMIIDDLIKNAEEAYNETVKQKHWDWFCFTGDTLVKTKEGNKQIKDIGIGDKVLSFNHSQYIIEEKEVVKIDNHLSSIYRLEFEHGKIIECTSNHKFYTTKGYISIEEILRGMQCTIEEGQTILFSDLSKQSKNWTRGNNNMPKLRENNSAWEKEQTNEILFYRMQTPIQDDRCTNTIYRLGKGKRFFERRKKAMPKMWFKGTSTCSSYRPRFKKQRFGQSSCTMPIVPYRLSQITRLPSNDLRRVYDIEVKDNHNLFANDMLVHNCNTMLSRLEEGGKIIIIMTRWASDDLAGRVLQHYQEQGARIKHVCMKALQDDGTMLCEEVLSRESYNAKVKAMGLDIASANYQQEPIDIRGRLYSSFKTYEHIPVDASGNPLFTSIRNYTDTADEGNDFLCSINYGVYNNEAYVLDVLYTKAAMETTEPATAKMLHEGKVNVADIESNNGGRGFGRSIERILRQELRSNRTQINTFHQSKNKIARILSNSTWVMNHIYFPANWRDRWPEYHDAMVKYQKEGKNKHDDGPDATTGIAEKIGQGDTFSFD